MKLLCTKGNAWATAGNAYTVISENNYVYQVQLDGITEFIHKAHMSYSATGGVAEFEVCEMEEA